MCLEEMKFPGINIEKETCRTPGGVRDQPKKKNEEEENLRRK